MRVTLGNRCSLSQGLTSNLPMVKRHTVFAIPCGLPVAGCQPASGHPSNASRRWARGVVPDVVWRYPLTREYRTNSLPWINSTTPHRGTTLAPGWDPCLNVHLPKKACIGGGHRTTRHVGGVHLGQAHIKLACPSSCPHCPLISSGFLKGFAHCRKTADPGGTLGRNDAPTYWSGSPTC